MQEETQYAPISLGDWILTLIIAAIPLVGFIMLLVWAFKPGVNPSKSNWAKAVLIFSVLLIVLFIAFGSMIPLLMPEMATVQQ